MSGFYDLVRKLDKIVHDPERRNSPSVTAWATDSQCSREQELHGHMYIFIPELEQQGRVREEIQQYAKDKGLHYVVTEHHHCPGNWECYGHYVDPFEAEGKEELVHIDELPKSINGTHIHFLEDKLLEDIRV